MGEMAEYLKGMLDRTLRAYSQEEVDRVRNSVMAIAGLGGVGAITAELLARWGVERFRLLDMDKYEPSNLNRQLFATSKTLGRYKVEVAAERIKEINPQAEIEMKIADRVSNENVRPFVQGADIVIQNADHPTCQLFYLIARECKVPLVNGYATISGGRVQAFDYREGPCLGFMDRLWQWWKFRGGKKLTEMSREELIEYDREHVHSTAPSINFVTNMVGCLIVAEAVKLLTRRGRAITYPKYIRFDLFSPGLKICNQHSPFNRDNWQRLKALLAR